jgi:hypothetical protein
MSTVVQILSHRCRHPDRKRASPITAATNIRRLFTTCMGESVRLAGGDNNSRHFVIEIILRALLNARRVDLLTTMPPADAEDVLIEMATTAVDNVCAGPGDAAQPASPRE